MNSCTFTGNLTKDPEIRYTTSGTAVATISIAVNSKVKKNDEWEDEVLYIDCISFGKRAEAAYNNLRKGSKVLAQGRLRDRQWEYEGKKQRKSELMIEVCEFLSGKQKPNETDTAPADNAPQEDPFN